MSTPVKKPSLPDSASWMDLPSKPAAASVRPNHDTPSAIPFLEPPQSSDELGRLGTYRVLRQLGQGGMGMVLEAENLRLQRRVALKVMLPSVAKDQIERERFLGEALAMAKIKSDYVVTVYHADVYGGIPYVEMELLEGQSLSHLLRGGPVPPLQVAQIGRDLALGLAAAHARGLIHRDINPGNAWLEPIKKASGSRRNNESGSLTSPTAPTELPMRAKLLDFGLARTTAGDVRLTQSGSVVGTPAYMAPEQARNQPLTPQADLFSLGVLLYEACTGKLPFDGDDALSVMMAIVTERPAALHELRPGLPPQLADLIMRLLEKNPQDRPAAAQDVADELQRILFSELPSEVDIAPVPIRTVPPTTPAATRAEAATSLVNVNRPTTTKRKKKKPAPKPTNVWATVAVIALVLLALVLGGMGWVLFRGKPPQSEPQALDLKHSGDKAKPVTVEHEHKFARPELPGLPGAPPGWPPTVPFPPPNWRPGDPPPWAPHWDWQHGQPPTPRPDWKIGDETLAKEWQPGDPLPKGWQRGGPPGPPPGGPGGERPPMPPGGRGGPGGPFGPPMPPRN